MPSPAALQARRFLTDLRVEIAHHPAVNHLFLNRLATAPFSDEDYRVFARNHFPLVCVFTHYLELLLLRAPDSEAKLWLARVLVDEYGEGSDGHDHATLYGAFLDATGGDARATRDLPVPRPAHRFIRTHQRLARTAPFLVGLGAVGPGHEWAIPEMFEAVIPGLRRAGLSEEAIGYFTLHVEQDGDHGAWLEEALVRYATTTEARAQIRRGALVSLEARQRFWDGVQSAVVRYRQPRSVRQDAERPRRLPRELALMLWDGFGPGRRLEDRVRRRLDARRPPLQQLLLQNQSPFSRLRGAL